MHLQDGPRLPFSSGRLFDLIEQHPAHWTPARLKIVYNATPIPPSEYCRPDTGVADFGRAREFAAHGASLVCDHAGAVAPELKHISDVLTRQLGGFSWANVYRSTQGIGGFGPHYDLTDVFALHCEGEKIWRLYEGRAADPTKFPPGDDAAVREHFKREAGAVEREVHMRPGDVLYIPAGVYHDAIAVSPISLHVTFAVNR